MNSRCAERPTMMTKSNQRALASFEQQYALTGVPTRRGERVIYRGWDRRTQRAVRIVIEPLD